MRHSSRAEKEFWLAHAISAHIIANRGIGISDPIAREELARHIAREAWEWAYLLENAIEATTPARVRGEV